MSARGILTAAAALVSAGMVAFGLQFASQGASSYRLTEGPEGVVRWNPCQTITYKYHVRALGKKKLKKQAIKDTNKAFRKMSKATGIKFQNNGSTRTVPTGPNWWRVQGVDEEIVVAWVKDSGKHTSDLFMGEVYGVGGLVYKTWTDDKGHSVAGRGYVLNHAKSYKKLKKGFKSGASRGNLLLHELGHALGLQHVSDKRQLMYDTLHRGTPKGFGSGDKAGLAAMGRDAGCIDVPAFVWVQ